MVEPRRPWPAVTPRLVWIDGRFEDWAAVEPEFRDDAGDPVRRDHAGWGQAGPYRNHTGRNDLLAVKISWDRSAVQFYARTRQPLTPCTDPAWMLLFIDADRDPHTDWLGYDCVVNRTVVGPQRTLLEFQAGSGFTWLSNDLIL
jgi:hypothetical protein